ncbi:unnamed protein product [Gemmataceae bacterium]|nr:unnamed protein product [Gemmataceae bacterium]VTT99530.1 unnamed protein product [Gemmataceae bacterium]
MNRVRLLSAAAVLGALWLAPGDAAGQYRRSCGTAYAYPPAQVYAGPAYYPGYSYSPAFPTPSVGYAPSGTFQAGPGCANGLCRPTGPQAGSYPYGSPVLIPGQSELLLPEGSGGRAQPPRTGIGGRVREGSGGR